MSKAHACFSMHSIEHFQVNKSDETNQSCCPQCLRYSLQYTSLNAVYFYAAHFMNSRSGQTHPPAANHTPGQSGGSD